VLKYKNKRDIRENPLKEVAFKLFQSWAVHVMKLILTNSCGISRVAKMSDSSLLLIT
jgi:hypothetical protein